MGAETTVSRTYPADDIHPCYESDNTTYIFTRNPSIICVILYIFLSSLSVVTICGNLLVIISVIYFKQLHIQTNYLILSLAVADLLVGVVVFPFSMAFTVTSCWYHQGLFCKVRRSFDVTLSTASILNLCCISIDRYYAVCQPLTYRSKITDRVVGIMILLSWGVAALIGIRIIIVGFTEGKCEDNCLNDALISTTLACIFSFYIPVIIMLSIYLKIFLVAQKQLKSIQSTKSGANVSKMERKATKTLAIVLGVFLLCWTPFFLCITFVPSSPVPVIEALNWLTLSNSMLNPFIYAFFYSWFRSAFRMIISGKIFQVIMILLSWSISAAVGIGIAAIELSSRTCDETCLLNFVLANTVGSILSFYLPAVIMLCIYLKIFLVAQKQVNSIQNTTCQSTKSGAAVSKTERKATKTLAIVMGVFLLSMIPNFLYLLFQPLLHETPPLSVFETHKWLTISNSMLNPFIYAFFYSWFRSAFMMILSGKIVRGDFSN